MTQSILSAIIAEIGKQLWRGDASVATLNDHQSRVSYGFYALTLIALKFSLGFFSRDLQPQANTAAGNLWHSGTAYYHWSRLLLLPCLYLRPAQSTARTHRFMCNPVRLDSRLQPVLCHEHHQRLHFHDHGRRGSLESQTPRTNQGLSLRSLAPRMRRRHRFRHPTRLRAAAYGSAQVHSAAI